MVMGIMQEYNFLAKEVFGSFIKGMTFIRNGLKIPTNIFSFPFATFLNAENFLERSSDCFVRA